MIDIVDKYYEICGLFDDDVHQVAFLIRTSGAHQRPAFIAKDLSYLWLLKYQDQIDMIYLAIQNKEAVDLLKTLSNFSIQMGQRYDFDPLREVKKYAKVK